MALIRRATAADAGVAARAYTAARAAAGRMLPPPAHTPEEDAWFVREILIGQRATWIALDRGRVVGLMTLDGDWLDQLYLTVRRTGLGSRFIELAKSERPDGLSLWTFASNTAAQRFYEHHGFIEIERTDGAGNEERAPDIQYRWMPLLVE